jgi:hypothetical protein
MRILNQISRLIFCFAFSVFVFIYGIKLAQSPMGVAVLLTAPLGLLIAFVLNPVAFLLFNRILKTVEAKISTQRNRQLYSYLLILFGIYGIIVPIKNYLYWNYESYQKPFYACENSEGGRGALALLPGCLLQVYSPIQAKPKIWVTFFADSCSVLINGQPFPNPSYSENWQAEKFYLNGKHICIAEGRCFQDNQMIACPSETKLPEKEKSIYQELQDKLKSEHTDLASITDESERPRIEHQAYRLLKKRLEQPQKVLGIDRDSDSVLKLEDDLLVNFVKQDSKGKYDGAFVREMQAYLTSSVVGKMVNVDISKIPENKFFVFYEPELKEKMINADIYLDGESLGEIYANIKRSERKLLPDPNDRRRDLFASEKIGQKLRASKALRNIKAGMTWGVISNLKGEIVVGCGGDPKLKDFDKCDPHLGDTPCEEFRPMLCVDSKSDRALPTINLTHSIQGSSLTSIQAANVMCETKFGTGWRMAEFHQQKGWQFKGKGELLTNDRFWVYINDKAANCWND